MILGIWILGLVAWGFAYLFDLMGFWTGGMAFCMFGLAWGYGGYLLVVTRRAS